MRRHVFGLGLAQVLLTMVFVTFGAMALHWLAPGWRRRCRRRP